MEITTIEILTRTQTTYTPATVTGSITPLFPSPVPNTVTRYVTGILISAGATPATVTIGKQLALSTVLATVISGLNIPASGNQPIPTSGSLGRVDQVVQVLVSGENLVINPTAAVNVTVWYWDRAGED
ncbi:MAG: hypothetical protein QXP58_06955 [Thermoprotei archaeon]